MRSARVIAVGLGILCSASLPALSAPAEQASELLVAPPELPQPVVELGSGPGATADAAISPPDLPDAAVVFTPADRLRAAIAAKLAQIPDIAQRLPRHEREALAAAYADAEPFFVGADGWTSAARSVIGRLRAADEDGLDAADYPIPVPAASRAATPAEWAEAELKLSAAAIRYARDARGGRIDPARLSALITPELDLPEAGEVLAALKAASDPGTALGAYNPSHEGYRALKARLAQLRATRRTPTPMVRVPRGPALRVGMRDPRVPLIRARFNVDPAAGDQTAYDERLASAVAAFQKEKGLRASGVLDAQTVAALGSGPSPARLEADLIANMERWRWLPVDLGALHLLVNVPEYRLRLVDQGQTVHQARVIVGKAETPTPLFSDEMEHVIVNPSWTVPPSIMKKEFLPALAMDPWYAARMGYRVIRRGGQIALQQPPGERNALGFVKFIFPNNHSVYLHDTPNRRLFSAGRRAFSHGCVRVDQPFRLAEEILQREGPWSEERLRRLVGKGERYIRVKQRLPVHIAYFTLMVDEKGELRTFDDLYGFHRKVKSALGFEG
jgi:murein L,D-transpeptidase YcbB/YkuD